MASDSKKAQKSEVLSMRVDPKVRFMIEILARYRGQSISTVVERAILEAADHTNLASSHEEKITWRDFWHVNDGIRALKIAGDQSLYPSFEDEYRLSFAKTHWPFFYNSQMCINYLEWSVDIIWPRIDEFVDIWSKTKATDYFAAGFAMQRAISAAGVSPPDWPVKKAEKPTVSAATPPMRKVPPWEPGSAEVDPDDDIPF